MLLCSYILCNLSSYNRPDYEIALEDFKARLANYEKVSHIDLSSL